MAAGYYKRNPRFGGTLGSTTNALLETEGRHQHVTLTFPRNETGLP